MITTVNFSQTVKRITDFYQLKKWPEYQHYRQYHFSKSG
uniref:Uncharacterized protein n=5 Tax=Enterobacteriaceae TaxID=543 RepID=U5KKU4_ECOLX|nr:hypothetical protein KPCE_123 [Escherichia coli]AGX00046.1 hypothetical protein pKo6_0056 [Klebsiella pneumoniae subsp. ozaenae]AVE23852.1 hypothetical protein [Enterobacter cloacae]AYN78012.1 hypothetical protein [Klebsiella pneumoniae]QBQ66600.1 Hypothetical protein [Leclercia adecarboxylata]UMW96555.1 hypothetical protein [Raoultella ornithinolytica]